MDLKVNRRVTMGMRGSEALSNCHCRSPEAKRIKKKKRWKVGVGRARWDEVWSESCR